jgi:plastocyanin
MTPRRLDLLRIACLGVLIAQSAAATPVTVSVRTASGTPAEDAVIVFDSLDETPVPSRDTVLIDQINKQFVPKVTILRTGTSVKFPNSDQIRHQVYSFSPAKTFSLKLYAGSPPTGIIFDKPGLVVLGCNIHDKMLAFVAVVDSPYFAKIDASGSATLNLPRGHYHLRVWHPQLTAAVPTQSVDIQEAPLSLSLPVDLQGSDPVAVWH